MIERPSARQPVQGLLIACCSVAPRMCTREYLIAARPATLRVAYTRSIDLLSYPSALPQPILNGLHNNQIEHLASPFGARCWLPAASGALPGIMRM